jgi:hypothetical protein
LINQLKAVEKGYEGFHEELESAAGCAIRNLNQLQDVQ